MKKNLLIIGAGGHGRCCLDIARETRIYEKINFLDDNAVGKRVNGAEILDGAENMSAYLKKYQDVFVAIGNNRVREKIIKQAKQEGFGIATLISEKAVVSAYATIGEGSVIFPNAVVEANAEVGKASVVAANSTINHDAYLQDYTLVNSNSVVRPTAVLEKYAMVGSHCIVSFGNIVRLEERVPDGTVK